MPGMHSLMKNLFPRFYSFHYLLPFIALVLYILICFFSPVSGFTADFDAWAAWARSMELMGFDKSYQTGAEYMPILLYILYLYNLFQSSALAITEHIHYLKYITLMFDFAAALAIVSFIKNKKTQLLLFLSIVFNIAYLYNTLIWGQVDAIHSAFLVFAVLALSKNNLTASSLCFTLAVCMKFQAIIYTPVFVLLWLTITIKNNNYFLLLKAAGLNLAMIVFLFAPFIYGTGLLFTFHHLRDAVLQHSNLISVQAYNFWELIIGGTLFNLSDSTIVWSMTYKTWGTILFLLFLIPSLFPLLKIDLTNLTPANTRFAFSKIFLSMALVTLTFFYFKTGMHERYAHSSIIFLAGYACLTFDFFPYIIGSVAYLFQLNNVMTDSNYVPLFRFYINKEFVSVLFLITILYCMFRIYYPVKKMPLPEHQ